MALGPLRGYVLDGVRQLILKSLADVRSDADGRGGSEADPVKPRANQEFVIVSHSLGSYLIFSALDVNASTAQTPAIEQWQNDLREILKHTSLVVFFANELRLLELVSLDGPTSFSAHQ